MTNDDKKKTNVDENKDKDKKNDAADELLFRANKAWERMKKSKPHKAADLDKAATATAAKASSIINEHLNGKLRRVKGSRPKKTL